MSQQFFAQRATGNAQHGRSLGLIAVGFFQGYLQHRTFYAADDHGEHVARLGVTQIREITFEAVAHGLFQGIDVAHDRELLWLWFTPPVREALWFRWWRIGRTRSAVRGSGPLLFRCY